MKIHCHVVLVPFKFPEHGRRAVMPGRKDQGLKCGRLDFAGWRFSHDIDISCCEKGRLKIRTHPDAPHLGIGVSFCWHCKGIPVLLT